MGPAEALLNAFVIVSFAILSGYYMFGWKPWLVLRPLAQRIAPTPQQMPTHRPLEELVSRARQVGPRVRSLEPGQRFAKFEGLRRGYDAVLADLCDELGVEHLLHIIPPGPALDRERERVELALTRAGLDLDLPLV